MKGTSSSTIRGKVRAHDPFELIRWLALSQPDPRKALAELVQNSLDAGARTVRVTRLRSRRIPCIRVADDGEGVIPDIDRDEALRFIATHIGHSRKRSLSPEERLQLLTQGQYGIGLLGFWSIGEQMEIRSAVPGQRPMRLVMYRDQPDFVIEPLRGRLPLGERWTEVLISGVHEDVLPLLGGRRAADYLAVELRGQLIERDVDMVVEDRMARGRAQKIIQVRPPRFLGERIDGLTGIEVPGHVPARMELYIAARQDGQQAPSPVAVYAAGTLVADSFHALSSIGLDRAPWTDSRLTGMVDFSAFQVTPGSRRDVVADAAAMAFAQAMGGVAPMVQGLLAQLDREREEAADRTLVRDLQRAFRHFYRQQPGYALLPVASHDAAGGAPDTPVSGTAADGATSAGGADEDEHDEAPEPAGAPQVELLPPGPLAEVRITPERVRVECRGTRRIRARPVDANARPIIDGVHFEWTVHGDVGELEQRRDPASVVLRAAGSAGQGTVTLVASEFGARVEREVPVEVVEELATGRSNEGIPTPDFVHEPGAGWRSRMRDARWEVNAGHRDYRASAERPALKLRYLAMLFAKEVVLRSLQDPRLERPLEQLVEVAGFADRNIAARTPTARKNRRQTPKSPPGGGS